MKVNISGRQYGVLTQKNFWELHRKRKIAGNRKFDLVDIEVGETITI